MKCLPTKTVILHVGDQQYPQNDLANVIKHFSKTVRTLSSAEIVGECIIMNDTDANHAAQCVADMKFDAVNSVVSVKKDSLGSGSMSSFLL